MKIGIVGYGRMGRLIREICLERGHTVPLVVDPNLQQAPHRSALADDLARANLNSVECVIDFSLPEAVLGNIEKYAENKTPAVIGTTGWEDKRDAVQTLIDQSGSSLLYGSNFSVGANIFFAMTARLAELINHFPQYDMLMHEFHHRHKKTAPAVLRLRLPSTYCRTWNARTKSSGKPCNGQLNHRNCMLRQPEAAISPDCTWYWPTQAKTPSSCATPPAIDAVSPWGRFWLPNGCMASRDSSRSMNILPKHYARKGRA